MYLSIVCGMFVCVSLYVNVCMLTVSNALLMSNATAIVRVGEMGWLKPVATGMFCVMYGRITFSSVFAITDRRDIILYDVPMLISLLGLGIGMMLASFHTRGILLSLSAALCMFVRYFSPFLPMCLRCFMLMLSGPVVLLFLLFLIAALTCSVVMFI